MPSQKPQSPINDLPPVVIALTLAILGVEVVLQLAQAGILGGARGIGWRMEAVARFGYAPSVLDQVLLRGDVSAQMLLRFVSYAFINTDLVQVAFCAALTLALGKFTAEYFGGLRVLVIYLAATIAGAVVYGLLARGNVPLLGGFVPVYGLIGAYSYALWLRLGQAGENQMRAFSMIGFLLGLQLLFGLIFGGGQGWIAELTGFVVGFGLAIVLAPGGWPALLRRMRRRG